MMASLGSLSSTSVTSSSGTYSTSQYCPSNKATYYSKAYVCPATSSLSSSPFSKVDDDFDKAFDAFASAASSTYSNFLGALIGGIVGGVVFIIILIVICCYCCCKKKKAAPAPMTPGDHVNTTMQTMQPQPMTINV